MRDKIGAELIEDFREHADLGRLGSAAGGETEGEGDAGGIIGAALAHHAGAELAGGFEVARLVPEREGLQGRIRASATDGAELAVGRIEGGHRRMRHGAFPKRVETAAVEFLAGAHAPLGARVGRVDDDALVEFFGLIGIDARAAEVG